MLDGASFGATDLCVGDERCECERQVSLLTRYPEEVHQRWAYPVAGVMLVGLVFAAASLSTQTKHALHLQGVLHPYLHLIVFALLAIFLFRSTSSAGLRVFGLVVLLGFGYATEAYESRQDGWPIEQQDVWIDALGVLAGAVVGAAVDRPGALR